MKQLAQYQDGRLELQEVPAPQPPPGGILVRTTCSVISPGTEKMKVEQARMSLLQKAKARPDQVRKVIDTARNLGWKAAMEKVRNRLQTPTPLGYSAAGVVVAVDELNARFSVGDRVACGGAECAFHAEMIAVPDLLAAPIPDGVTDWQAAYTTLAAIAMQAVRQAGAGLGDRVVVIGQGMIGLLVTQLLAAAGSRVLAVDLNEQRLAVARLSGAEWVATGSHGRLADDVSAWTEGHGADAVLLCVGGGGKELGENAVSSLRDRGVLVIVGMHDIELAWRSACLKDIEVRYARSYGPGRYDAGYEWGGHDYPIGHVRWTENRNFEACLHLLQTGVLDVGPITTRRVAFRDAVAAYEDLMQGDNADIGVVLNYEKGPDERLGQVVSAVSEPREAVLAAPSAWGITGLSVIGAGNFARTMLLPHLQGRIRFGTVVNATGLSARHVKEKFGFAEAGTDTEAAFGKDGEAVLIATRHQLHGGLVVRGLTAHQHVFVEKPLCLSEEELERIDEAAVSSRGSVMVGFNRRFAPATTTAKELLRDRAGPRSLMYQVCAGPADPDHWHANEAESGGRILGEVCHFLDFFCAVFESAPVQLSAQRVGRESVQVQVGFEDESSAQLTYSAEGDPGFPKESWRLFARGLVVECENFQTLRIHQNRKVRTQRFRSKGHAEEMAAWLGFLEGRHAHPVPYREVRQSTLLTFAVKQALRENRMIHLK
jgi:predicted dehydrogenase/threonine dehydrogenase-like Zn-dependent dehydrogenase